MVVSEMLTSRADLRGTAKSRFRSDLAGEPEPVVVQIVGTEPALLAEAARYNVDNGAQIIDINMGCPAKKVCKKAAGSALLADEPLVADILQHVVAAVQVPVTLKIRTGTSPDRRNAVTIAKIAENSGVLSLAVHGRTRECKFNGQAEYDTIAEIKQAAGIPIIANGDIDSPQKAHRVLDQTGADAVMIGRAAQGRPWLFRQIAEYLQKRTIPPAPEAISRAHLICNHVNSIHEFYGERLGVRFARKHIKWYLQHWEADIGEELRFRICTTENAPEQRLLLEEYLFESMPLSTAKAA